MKEKMTKNVIGYGKDSIPMTGTAVIDKLRELIFTKYSQNIHLVNE